MTEQPLSATARKYVTKHAAMIGALTAVISIALSLLVSMGNSAFAKGSDHALIGDLQQKTDATNRDVANIRSDLGQYRQEVHDWHTTSERTAQRVDDIANFWGVPKRSK
jgi:hypothetical protein